MSTEKSVYDVNLVDRKESKVIASATVVASAKSEAALKAGAEFGTELVNDTIGVSVVITKKGSYETESEMLVKNV